MLRRTPSLALRAGLIFMSIYTIIFAAFLAVVLLSSSGDFASDRWNAPRAAVKFAASELQANRSFELSDDGSFGRLAAKNPALWLIARSGNQAMTVGRPPDAAFRFFDQYRATVRIALFTVPEAEVSLSAAMIRQFDYGPEPLVIAAGGVNPASLTVQDSFMLYGPEDALMALITIALLGFLPMLVALPFFARAIRPITAEAAALRPEDLDRRLDERKAPRELLPLVGAFNETLDRLAAELARRKRFIADAAHELRTPLAVVSLRVESLSNKTAKLELRRGIERLVHIVSQMLDVERLSLAGRERTLLDLVAVARDVVADLAPTAIKCGYELSLEAPEGPVEVSGDVHAISRAITNLVANAVTHGGGAGQISVVVGADRTIDVIDEGPGVPEALRPRLFEPFSRGSQDTEGCGLGLHLTREIMLAHGGEVDLLPTQGGARFRLSFAAPVEDGVPGR